MKKRIFILSFDIEYGTSEAWVSIIMASHLNEALEIVSKNEDRIIEEIKNSLSFYHTVEGEINSESVKYYYDDGDGF